MGCFETYWTTVSSGHLDDTMQAAWRHATFFIRPCFLCVFNAGGSLDTIRWVKFIPSAKLKNVCAD